MFILFSCCCKTVPCLVVTQSKPAEAQRQSAAPRLSSWWRSRFDPTNLKRFFKLQQSHCLWVVLSPLSYIHRKIKHSHTHTNPRPLHVNRTLVSVANVAFAIDKNVQLLHFLSVFSHQFLHQERKRHFKK